MVMAKHPVLAKGRPWKRWAALALLGWGAAISLVVLAKYTMRGGSHVDDKPGRSGGRGARNREQVHDCEEMRALAERIQAMFREHENRRGDPNYVDERLYQELITGEYSYHEDGSGFHLGSWCSFDAKGSVMQVTYRGKGAIWGCYIELSITPSAVQITKVHRFEADILQPGDTACPEKE
jgi:hypothetical protein